MDSGGLRLQLTYADVSQDGTSEEFIGEWAEKRGIRDQLVIATKASPDSPRYVSTNYISRFDL